MMSLLLASLNIFAAEIVTENYVELKPEVSMEKMRPWPRVSAWGNSVEVSIQNYDDQSYRCSGSVWMRLESGRSRSEYVSILVYPRSSAYKRIYNYNPQDRIRSASHTISCF